MKTGARRERDPRSRVLLCVIFITTVSLFRSWPTLVLATGLGLGAAAWAGLTPARLVWRLLWVIPFSAAMVLTLPLVTPGEPLGAWAIGPLHMVVTREGLVLAGFLGVRVLTCALAVLALAASTPVPSLLWALEALRVPRLLVVLPAMTLRYIDVLRDEARRLARSRRSRCYRPGRHLWDRNTLRTAAQTIGALFLRAQDRSERIYWSMLSRGYSIHRSVRRPAPYARADLLQITLVAAAALALLIIDHQARGV